MTRSVGGTLEERKGDLCHKGKFTSLFICLSPNRAILAEDLSTLYRSVDLSTRIVAVRDTEKQRAR